jgi:hypothetical protein
MTKSKLHVVGAEERRCPEPPRPLGKAGRDLWGRIHAAYNVSDAGGIQLLCEACVASDRAEGLAEEIAKDGMAIRTARGVKDHPLIRHELAARSLVCRLLCRMGLNYEAVRAPGRPVLDYGPDLRDWER